MKKKIILFLFASLILASLVFAEDLTPVKSCCEKTTYGAWCQNAPTEQCDNNYRIVPTSCDATSYCRQGCCYDSLEGTCMENTPEKVCSTNGGTWADSKECEIPQCNMGCCVLGSQAAFVTLTRCKKLSSFYSLLTDFRAGIKTELECVSLASLSDEGACVYGVDFIKTCKYTTRQGCDSIKSGTVVGNASFGGQVTGNVSFFKDFLCSAEDLGTNCGMSKQTMCVPGKDEVYFVDTCGNPANIYDSSKVNDKTYWRKKISKEDACGFGNSNSNSKTCGNCDYYLGGICRKTDRFSSQASYGDYMCKDLNCKDTTNGKDMKHGESWCSYDGEVGNGLDLVGSRQVRHICINGEEIVEPCADLRAQICIEDTIKTDKGDFSQAGCRVNRWQSCTSQTKQSDCLNLDKRECFWDSEGMLAAFQNGTGVGQQIKIQSNNFSSSGGTTTTNFAANTATSSTASTSSTTSTSGITGKAIFGLGGDDEENKTSEMAKGVCLPMYPPGFKFWDEGSDAKTLCSQASVTCQVQYEKKGYFFSGDAKCVKNCQCLTEAWAAKQNRVCVALGDCGAYKNIAGKETTDGIEWRKDNIKEDFEEGILSSFFNDLCTDCDHKDD